MQFEILTLLFVVAVAAGTVDAIAGGGGLITLPALLLTGISPAQALATNKIVALASVASSAHRYMRSGEVDVAGMWPRVIASVVGATVGACVLRITDPTTLARIAPFILICVASFFLFSRNFLTEKRRPLLDNTGFALLAALPIGFYDGFFGPGTGSRGGCNGIGRHTWRANRSRPRLEMGRAAHSSGASTHFSCFGNQAPGPAIRSTSLAMICLATEPLYGAVCGDRPSSKYLARGVATERLTCSNCILGALQIAERWRSCWKSLEPSIKSYR